MRSESTILVFVAYYLPGYKAGGPIRSIANMVELLGEEFHFKIVTADRDTSDIIPYPNIKVDDWNRVGKAEVYYCSPGNNGLMHLKKLITKTDYDILYLNSFFSYSFSIKPLLLHKLGLIPKRPVVLAPRGEFSKGALRIRSFKKHCYIHVMRLLGLCNNVTWQASSNYEKEDICSALGNHAVIRVAKNLPSPIKNLSSKTPETSAGRLKVIFLSRISPKKNLDYALRVLQKVNVPLTFNIYGVIDDQRYWQACRLEIERLPENIKVKYHGDIPHSQVGPTLQQQDLFLFPTKGENYGHVIYEALTAGVPVLISDQTPWDDIEQHRAGWAFPLNNKEKYVSCIQEYASTDSTTRKRMREGAMKYAKDILTHSGTLEANRNLFLKRIK